MNLRALLPMLLISTATAAASIYSPDLVLVKTDDCRAASRSIVNQPTGRYDTQYPYGELTLVAGHLGSEATALPIAGDLRAYTGLQEREPALARGAQRDATQPPTALQLACGEAAFLVNTRQVQAADGANVQYKITWAIPPSARLHPSIAAIIAQYQPTRVQPGAAEIRPWAQAGEPDLILQANVRIPTVSLEGTPNVQYNLSFYVLDTISGMVFDYIVNLYNNEAFAPGIGPSHDGLSPFISVMLPPDGSTDLQQRYYTLSPYSAGSSITPWAQPRFFRIHVGRQQLINAIEDVNAAYDAGLSVDPSNYLLIDAGVIQEHARLAGSSVLMGSSLQGFGVYTASNADVAQSLASDARPPAERVSRR